MKRPSFQFYPGDWLRDTALRSCSCGARGLWMDMLCLMHEGSPYGHLKVGTKVILKDNLARMTGITLPQAEGWLKELSKAGVFSTGPGGVIFSRRMVRDEELRQKRAKGGKLGGNPLLLNGQKVNHEVGNKVNLQANLPPTPSSSSSFASASATTKIPTKLPPSFTKAQVELVARFDACLGSEWENDRQKWMGRIKHHGGKTERVVAELENAKREGRIKTTPARYAEQTWKDFL